MCPEFNFSVEAFSGSGQDLRLSSQFKIRMVFTAGAG